MGRLIRDRLRIICATVGWSVLAACGAADPPAPAPPSVQQAAGIARNVAEQHALRAVLQGHRQLAESVLEDARQRADALAVAVETLIDQPNPVTLAAARQRWVAAREPYSLAETLRFGHWFMDEADARINAWPIDEGLLDYVAMPPYAASMHNPLAQFNLVAAADRVVLGERTLSTTPIQRITLLELQTQGDFESNIATGYHAIEFLLWGQDLSATGPGDRPWTDYALQAGQCTDGPDPAPLRHCERRAMLLRTMMETLVHDLTALRAQWADTPGSFGDRFARGDLTEGLRRILFSLATFSAEELAGERMRVAQLSGSQEEELDCFSDTTHRSLYWNALGVAAFYRGHVMPDTVDSVPPGLAQWLAARLPTQAARIDAALEQALRAQRALFEAGEAGQSFDRIIAPDNKQGAALLRAAISAHDSVAHAVEAAAAALGLDRLNPQAGRVE